MPKCKQSKTANATECADVAPIKTRGVLRCSQCEIAVTDRPDWGRYEKNGRLKVLCPDCDAENIGAREQQRHRNAVAVTAGYSRGWTSTPEYHRMQRETVAAREGRTLDAYVPQAERDRQGRMVDADRLATRIRSQSMREWLRPFRKSDRELYQTDAEYRAKKQAAYRATYARRPERERARSRAWNTSHLQERLAQQYRRTNRVISGADGTASAHAIAQLKEQAPHCAYCAVPLTRKETDHMVALVLGGAHSLRNIVIVCPTCNRKKGTLSYPEWTERVAPEHRGRVIALYLDRYCDAAA